jgi:hypothetical protein
MGISGWSGDSTPWSARHEAISDQKWFCDSLNCLYLFADRNRQS